MDRWIRSQMTAAAVLAAVTGVAVLAGTWFFYRERLFAPGNDFLAWVQPTLLVLGGLLALVGAALLVARRPLGPEVLKLAVGMIPVILVARLIVVALRGVGQLIGVVAATPGRVSPGALIERIALNPLSLIINLALIAVVVAIATLNQAGKTDSDSPKAGER